MSWRQFNTVLFLLGVMGMCPAREAWAVSMDGGSPSTEPVQGKKGEQQVRSRLEQINTRLAELKAEETALRTQAREYHRQRHDLRRQLEESDTDVQVMMKQIVELQEELHALQEALAQRIQSHPAYAEQNSLQSATFERVATIQQEIMALSSERAQLQLKLESGGSQGGAPTELEMDVTEQAEASLEAEESDQ